MLALVAILTALFLLLLGGLPAGMWWWVGAMSVGTLLVFGHDKMAALRHDRRVPERMLLFLAMLGGAPGIAAGEFLFYHKTLKTSFNLPFLVILSLQCLVFVVIRLCCF